MINLGGCYANLFVKETPLILLRYKSLNLRHKSGMEKLTCAKMGYSSFKSSK